VRELRLRRARGGAFLWVLGEARGQAAAFWCGARAAPSGSAPPPLPVVSSPPFEPRKTYRRAQERPVYSNPFLLFFVWEASQRTERQETATRGNRTLLARAPREKERRRRRHTPRPQKKTNANKTKQIRKTWTWPFQPHQLIWWGGTLFWSRSSSSWLVELLFLRDCLVGSPAFVVVVCRCYPLFSS